MMKKKELQEEETDMEQKLLIYFQINSKSKLPILKKHNYFN